MEPQAPQEDVVGPVSCPEIQDSSSSVVGSEHRQHPHTQFPLYHPTTTASYQPAVFSRSLLPLGHGFAAWDPGAKSRPIGHLEIGVGIGDVGFIDNEGGLHYGFNIFYPPDHPAQHSSLPRNFCPVEPSLSEWKVQKAAKHQEGEVLTSPGLNVSRVSQEPLEIEFVSEAREGACLILPQGATREDLENVHELYPYIREHASDWYQFLNDYSDIPLSSPVVNGTLFIVTGVDKTPYFTSALFPTEESERRKRTAFKYHAKALDNRDLFEARSVISSSEQLTTANGKHPSAVFIRGLTVALGNTVWNFGLAPIPLNRLPLYYIPSIPPFGRWSGIIGRFRRGPEEDDNDEPGEAIFHPSILLSQILLDINPDAEMAIVEDATWCSFMDGRPVTVSEVEKLVTQIVDKFQIALVDGVVHFAEASNGPAKNTIKERLQFWIQFLTTGSMRSKYQQQALRKLKKLLSKPDLLQRTNP